MDALELARMLKALRHYVYNDYWKKKIDEVVNQLMPKQ